MAAIQQAEGRLSHLPKSDGSATFADGGHIVVASVSGPIEAQRRDENPFEAVVDVAVRPAAGVGGTRERHLEFILQTALRQLILVKRWPRCVFQITLQVTHTPPNDYVNSKVVQAKSNLLAFPPLFHAALLALLSAAVPLKSMAASVIVAIPSDGSNPKPRINPSSPEANEASSLHLVGFTTQGTLLLAESEGDFSEGDWMSAVDLGRRACNHQMRTSALEETGAGEDSVEALGMVHVLRSITEAKVASEANWR